MSSTFDFTRARGTLIALSFALVAVFGACSSESTSSPSTNGSSGSSGASSGSSPAISADACASRCKAKLDRCGAPAEQTEQGCGQLCNGSVTEAQATCFEAKDCEQIAAAESLDDLCPKGTSGSTSSSGSTGTGTPTTLKVTGSFGSVKAIHTSSDGKIASAFSAAPKPKFDPAAPSPLPDVTDESVLASVSSPPLGDCAASINFTLNATQVGITITGVDTLPAADCATFTDAVAKNGIKATLANVPYPGSETRATVTIELSP